MRRSIQTIIVDQSALFRAGVMHILSGTRFRVTVVCSSLDDVLIHGAFNDEEGLMLIGLDENSCDILSQVGPFKEQHEKLRIIMLGDRFDLEELLRAIESGVDGYFLKKQVSADVLLKGIDLVFLGEMIVPQGIMKLIGSRVRERFEALPLGDGIETHLESSQVQFAVKASKGDDFGRLSGREQLILRHLMQGPSNKQIARNLNVAEATVKVHVKAILRKIGVKNRTQAAMWALKHQLEDRDSPAAARHLHLVHALAPVRD